MTTINIPEQFSRTPGPRYIDDGPNSGEEFRKTHLEPLFTDPAAEGAITIVLDGAMGYPTSFLEEAFGGLVRVVGNKAKVLKRLRFVSERDPTLIEEIHRYIDEAANG